MEALSWILANYQAVLSGVVGLLTAVIALSLLIPGEQPEKMLQGWVDFLSKFSNK